MKTSEQTKKIIWTSDWYTDEKMQQEFWQYHLEDEVDNIDVYDVANALQVSIGECNEEEQQALETLLPKYKEAQMKRPCDLDYWYNNVDGWLDDERRNLDIQLPGYILCIADLGMWDGRRLGIKKVGSNIKDILCSNDDFCEWYADEKDIRLYGADHDGSSHYLYRYVDSIDVYEALCDKASEGKLTQELFMEKTKSLLPFVANIYGWDVESI